MKYKREMQLNRLKEHLEGCCVGQANAAPAAVLATESGSRGSHASQPYTRELIRELINKGLPVVSTTEGYFIPESSDEFLDYYRNMERRAGKIMARLEKVAVNFFNYTEERT